MSKVKTSVIYPRWANKYLPNTPYQNGTSRFSLTMDDKVIALVDNESENGIPDLLETLERFGIPYDHRCEALDGDPAYVVYNRSRKDGSTEARHVCESDRLLDVGELIKLLDGERPFETIRRLCLDVDNDTRPLEPNIREFPEQEYQEWRSCKPLIYRANITNVYRKTTCYAFDHVRPGFCTIFGVTGHLIESRQDDSNRHYSWFNERQLDVLEREFPYVFFGVTGDPVVPDDGSALHFEPGHPAVFIPSDLYLSSFTRRKIIQSLENMTLKEPVSLDNMDKIDAACNRIEPQARWSF